jgi:hypothetical protein
MCCLVVLSRVVSLSRLVSFVRVTVLLSLVVVSSSSHCDWCDCCLVVLSRCLVSLSFLVATCRCLLLCLPLALLSTALSESAVSCSSLLCWSLFSVVSYSCLVYLSCLFAWVVCICLTVDSLWHMRSLCRSLYGSASLLVLVHSLRWWMHSASRVSGLETWHRFACRSRLHWKLLIRFMQWPSKSIQHVVWHHAVH